MAIELSLLARDRVEIDVFKLQDGSGNEFNVVRIQCGKTIRNSFDLIPRERSYSFAITRGPELTAWARDHTCTSCRNDGHGIGILHGVGSSAIGHAALQQREHQTSTSCNQRR